MLVSVLTPSYNRAASLPDLYNSLCQQRHDIIEWIVGNDGNDVKTTRLIDELAISSPFKIRSFASSLRVGKAVIDNNLLNLAEGDFVIWCDAGDVFIPYSIDKMVALFDCRGGNKDFFGVVGLNVDAAGRSQSSLKRKVNKEEVVVSGDWLNQNLFGDATLLLRRDMIGENRFPEVDFVVTESALWRPLFLRKKFILLPEVVKVMERNYVNSVSFGKKLQYSRGLAYGIGLSEEYDIFYKKKLTTRIKKIINFFRYCHHADIGFYQSGRVWPLLRRRRYFYFAYPFGVLFALRDLLLGKVEKTHLVFNENIKYATIHIGVSSATDDD